MAKKYIVRLTEEERTDLESLIHKGKVAAHKRLHAEILLKADISELGEKWLDSQISEVFGISTRTVERVRERLVQEGLESALNRAKPIRVKSRVIDGEKEAHLLALACGDAPDGRSRWTLRLLGLLAPTPNTFGSFSMLIWQPHEQPKDSTITARMGVWVSGFFGSGKSHYIKILSYLLENIEAIDPKTGNPKKAADFFDEHKIKDPLLLADIHKAIKGTADVILFNIDAKADAKSDRDAIVQVFLRVFNEKQGLCGDAPHIAEMERYLIAKGAYDTFKTIFQARNGNTWQQERDAVDFLRDEVIAALAQALNMTEESAGRWFDNARDDYRINIEGLAKLVRDYLDTKPAGHRLIFLADEVGQFIGDNTQLMLSLQTIVEQLGTLCQGRAWVIVTSQEDIDAAIGEANKAKSQDFSKIQARFYILMTRRYLQ